jgi:hypothetical protein
MKRSSWISVLAAGGLLVAGCSSSSGTAAPATTSTSAESSSSSSTSSSATSSKSATSSEDGSSTQASAAELDDSTKSWFTTFCTGLTDATQYASPDTTGQSLTDAQSTVVTAYNGIAASTSKLAVDLQAAPPPNIDSGDEISSTFITGFQGLSDVYGRGAATIAALTPSTEADLKSAIDAVEEEAKGVQPASTPDLDPSVEAAVEQIPECSSLGS